MLYLLFLFSAAAATAVANIVANDGVTDVAIYFLLLLFLLYAMCSTFVHLQVQHPLRLVVFALLRAFQFSFKIQMKTQTR